MNKIDPTILNVSTYIGSSLGFGTQMWEFFQMISDNLKLYNWLYLPQVVLADVVGAPPKNNDST